MLDPYPLISRWTKLFSWICISPSRILDKIKMRISIVSRSLDGPLSSSHKVQSNFAITRINVNTGVPSKLCASSVTGNFMKFKKEISGLYFTKSGSFELIVGTFSYFCGFLFKVLTKIKTRLFVFLPDRVTFQGWNLPVTCDRTLSISSNVWSRCFIIFWWSIFLTANSFTLIEGCPRNRLLRSRQSFKKAIPRYFWRKIVFSTEILVDFSLNLYSLCSFKTQIFTTACVRLF